MARAPHRPTVYFDARRGTTEQCLIAALIATRRGRMAQRLIGLAQLGMRVENLIETQSAGSLHTLLADPPLSFCDRRFLKVALKLSEIRTAEDAIVASAIRSGNKAGRIRALAMIGLKREAFLERQAENLIIPMPPPSPQTAPRQHEAFAAV